MPKRYPNVVLIVMDAVRASHLSCYGYHRPTTPFLDQLAEQGILFEQAISPASWTLPSHASMFTGVFPSRHGAHDEHHYLDYTPTLAEILRTHGYKTAAFCQNPWVSSFTGLDRGFAHFPELSWQRQKGFKRVRGLMIKLSDALTGNLDSGARVTNRAVAAWLRRHAREAPFFLFIHYLEPHVPYRLPRAWRNTFLTMGSYSKAVKVNQDRVRYLENTVPMSERDFGILRDLYDSEIAYLDSVIAQVVRWLREAGQLDDTILIVTSDHGENLGEHNLMGHGLCLYESLIWVPLLVRYPRALPTGVGAGEQVQTLDIFPTVLDLVGIPVGESVQGTSLVAGDRARPFTIAEMYRPDFDEFSHPLPHLDRRLRAIRTARYKFIWSSDGRHELYDLLSDPDELNNIVGLERATAERLNAMLAEWTQSFEHAHPSADEPEVTPEVEERLRALGYIN